jgi:hypothetical protein
LQRTCPLSGVKRTFSGAKRTSRRHAQRPFYHLELFQWDSRDKKPNDPVE